MVEAKPTQTAAEEARALELAGMMEESDKAWRDSFDPKHPDYHGGSQEVAPYNE